MKVLGITSDWFGRLFERFRNWLFTADDLADSLAYLRWHRRYLTDEDWHFVLLMEEKARNGTLLSEQEHQRLDEIREDLNSQLAW